MLSRKPKNYFSIDENPRREGFQPVIEGNTRASFLEPIRKSVPNWQEQTESLIVVKSESLRAQMHAAGLKSEQRSLGPPTSAEGRPPQSSEGHIVRVG
jgi:hypothetical protein